MGYSENFISQIMSIETELETYEESSSLTQQKKVLQDLLVKAEKMKNTYLEGEDETFIQKIKYFFGFQKREKENELLPMIDDLIARILEENKKVGNLYR